MPDIPGSGPTDPDIIVRAIASGATYRDGGTLRMPDGSDRWLAVADVPGSGPTDPERPPARQWILVHTKGVRIEADTFDVLARCVVRDKLVIDKLRTFALVAPLPHDRSQVAHLAPA